ncbi:reticulon-like protein B2 [Curcuma longa]|uniref:reticulon-like protein B2 n=1 Tax=Curcuma longa TaxID=136217 RepID=UPI003D9F50FA
MAEHGEESLLEKITDHFHGSDSSSSDSGDERSSGPSAVAAAAEAANAKIYRLFGRQKPLHTVLGGGKPADVFLWRNRKISASTLGSATAIWVLFELLEYHLLTLVGHALIFSLAIVFLWSTASTFISKSRPNIPEISIPEDPVVNVALSLGHQLNWLLASLREVAMGRDLKKFLIIIGGLWLVSIIGNCVNFLTLFYIVFVALYTVPVLYEKYEDKIDGFAEKAEAEFKKHYAVVHAKYLSKIPKVPLKDKKLQ